MHPALALLIMVGCLALEAFFSGSEIGAVSANRVALRHQAAAGSRGARLALSMLEKPEWLLSTTLVGTNIAVVTNTTVATALVIQLLGEAYSWLAVVLVAPLIWVFGEVVPKSVFQQQADAITPRAVYLLRAASFLFSPILVVFTALTRVVGRVLGGGEPQNPFTLREEIVALMERPGSGGDILPAEQHMIRRVFRFGETTARDILVPLIDVVGVERGATCGEAVRVAAERAHKRLPVYEERVDRIVGLVNALDVMLVEDAAPLDPYVQPVLHIPGS
jgi:CBS domain containing-hemolysin-like protein